MNVFSIVITIVVLTIASTAVANDARNPQHSAKTHRHQRLTRGLSRDAVARMPIADLREHLAWRGDHCEGCDSHDDFVRALDAHLVAGTRVSVQPHEFESFVRRPPPPPLSDQPSSVVRAHYTPKMIADARRRRIDVRRKARMSLVRAGFPLAVTYTGPDADLVHLIRKYDELALRENDGEWPEWEDRDCPAYPTLGHSHPSRVDRQRRRDREQRDGDGSDRPYKRYHRGTISRGGHSISRSRQQHVRDDEDLYFPRAMDFATSKCRHTEHHDQQEDSVPITHPPPMPIANASAIAASLLESVYGKVSAAKFPLPLPSHEAGRCANNDRRYLWTDSFAVLCYTALADSAAEQDAERKQSYLDAASKLLDAVQAGLGAPRCASADCAMLPRSDGTGFVGMRIGKEHFAKHSDAGMELDGQYAHYTDKYLFALTRFGQVAGDRRRIGEAASLAKAVFPHFFDSGLDGKEANGIRWKLNLDSSPIRGCEYGHGVGSGDTLTALWAFALIENAQQKSSEAAASAASVVSLAPEITLLRRALRADAFRAPPVTHDPLGFGLEAWIDAWLQPAHRRTDALLRAAPAALDPRHLQLPFRLYGALLGMNTPLMRARAPPELLSGRVDPLLERCVRFELDDGGVPEFSSINRVMLATALLAPSPVFSPLRGEPQLP